jgi:hypothetical protein
LFWKALASEELVLCYSLAEGVLKIDSLQRVILQPGHSEVGGSDGDCCSCRIVSYSNDADTESVNPILSSARARISLVTVTIGDNAEVDEVVAMAERVESDIHEVRAG